MLSTNTKEEYLVGDQMVRFRVPQPYKPTLLPLILCYHGPIHHTSLSILTPGSTQSLKLFIPILTLL